jgi:Xaa-Pro aminopeptidase
MISYALAMAYIGVGHGVGAALNVHEGPHSISRNLNVHQALVPGMIVSNEPGYYETGNFGIRIENLLVVTERPEMGEFGGRGFLGFEKLTLIPIQKKMINKDLLSPAEVQWLNEYHKEVREKVSPYVRTEEVKKWLEESTSEL